MPNYWMLVSAPENFEKARSLGFPVLAMKSRHRKKAERVAAGDRVVFYTTGRQALAGTFTATGPYFEDHVPLFQSKKDGEDYPFRFPVRPDVVLAADNYQPVVDLLPVLAFPKKWPADHWHLAFQGNVHPLSTEDFEVIESAMLARVPQPA